MRAELNANFTPFIYYSMLLVFSYYVTTVFNTDGMYILFIFNMYNNISLINTRK